MDLSEIRKQIDQIDNEFVRLFVARMNLSAQVADYKRAHDLPIYVPEREQKVLLSVSEKAGPEFSSYTRELYAVLFDLSKRYQSERNSK